MTRFVLVALGCSLLVALGCAQAAPARPTDANAVLDALVIAGLPIGARTAYTAETDPNVLLGRPGAYTGKTAFIDTRLGEESGSVEVFANAEDAKRRLDYIDIVTKSSPLFTEYHWLKGLVFLRVSRKLTPDQAAQYEAALAALTL